MLGLEWFNEPIVLDMDMAEEDGDSPRELL